MMRRARKTLWNAFASPGARLFGLRFTRDYLRVAVGAAARWGDTSAGELRMLGRTVRYPNRAYALFLLHEIFVNAEYAFQRRNPRPRIVDCGANIGMSVLFFTAYAPGASIVAIEADPTTFVALRRTVDQNNLADIELINAAVAATDGAVALYSAAGDSGSITASVVPEWGGGASQTVSARRLSSIVTAPVDFLKLDVEGAEYDVVDELASAGRLELIAEAVIECHDTAERRDARAALIERLRQSGMRVTLRHVNERSRIAIVHAVRESA